MPRRPDPSSRIPWLGGSLRGKAGETSRKLLKLVGFIYGFFLIARTVVPHNNNAPSNFFNARGGPCNKIDTLFVKCVLGDSESVELTTCEPACEKFV